MTGIIAILALFTAGQGAKTPDPGEILELALKQRQGIKTFAGTFRWTLTKSGGTTSDWGLRLWLDGKRLRQDRLAGEGVKEITCINCEKEGQFIQFHSADKVSVQYEKMDSANYRDIMLVDPRVVGLQTAQSGFLWNYKLDTSLGSADRSAPTSEKTKWNGIDGYVVRFKQTTTGRKLTYWIVPSMDYSVVRVDFEITGKNVITTRSLKCEMEKHGKPGVWFPKSYVAEEYKGGKLTWSEKLAITDVKINEDLPVDTFRFAGMNIPAGRTIYGNALPTKRSKIYQWDGKEIIEVDRAKNKEPTKEMSEASPVNRGMLLAGAGGLSVVGAVALCRVFWPRGSGKPTAVGGG